MFYCQTTMEPKRKIWFKFTYFQFFARQKCIGNCHRKIISRLWCVKNFLISHTTSSRRRLLLLHTSCKILRSFCKYDLIEITSWISCMLLASLLVFPPPPVLPQWLHIVATRLLRLWKKSNKK